MGRTRTCLQTDASLIVISPEPFGRVIHMIDLFLPEAPLELTKTAKTASDG